jgi:hypothetical protein
MEAKNIAIDKGRTGRISINVKGITVWDGLRASFYSTKFYGQEPILELIGSINPATNTVLFMYQNEDTEYLDAGRYYYEVVIYKDDLIFAKTSNIGILTINPVIKVKPGN